MRTPWGRVGEQSQELTQLQDLAAPAALLLRRDADVAHGVVGDVLGGVRPEQFLWL